ncbi:MAG: hypothetical protein ACRDWX_10505 [Acidimicrobiia bacterium]
MILRLEVPFLDTNIPYGVLQTWHVSEGGGIDFGEPLCDILAEDYLAMRRGGLKAYRAARLVERRETARPRGYFFKKGRVHLIFRLISSEPDTAVLRALLAQEGAPLQTGDPLALVVTNGEEVPVEVEPVSQFPLMRVVADCIETQEELS